MWHVRQGKGLMLQPCKAAATNEAAGMLATARDLVKRVTSACGTGNVVSQVDRPSHQYHMTIFEILGSQ